MIAAKILKRNKEKGSIALTSVILLSSILLLAGISLILATIDITTATTGFYNLNTARNQARGCIEESLYKISRNSAYTGSFSVTYATGSCSTTVTNDSPTTTKILTTTSTVGVYNLTIVKKVDTLTVPFAITN
jgi:hypothetical protein